MGQDITIENKANKSDIVSLFLTSDPRHQRSLAYYDYSNVSSFGESTYSIAKNSTGEVVGHYAILPLKFKYLNKEYNVGYAQQAITHKDYRSLDLISKLHNHAINNVKDDLDLIFAFSNDSFAQIKKSLFGWNDLGAFSSSVIDLKLVDFKINHDIEELVRFNHDFSPDENKFSLIKSCDYLNHRFLEHPINFYKTFIVRDFDKIIGYISLKLYQDNGKTIGHFVDFESKDINIMKSLIAKAKEFFLFYGVKKVVFWNMSCYQELFDTLIVGEGFTSNFLVYDLTGNKNILDRKEWSLSLALSDAF